MGFVPSSNAVLLLAEGKYHEQSVYELDSVDAADSRFQLLAAYRAGPKEPKAKDVLDLEPKARDVLDLKDDVEPLFVLDPSAFKAVAPDSIQDLFHYFEDTTLQRVYLVSTENRRSSLPNSVLVHGWQVIFDTVAVRKDFESQTDLGNRRPSQQRGASVVVRRPKTTGE